MTKIQANDTPDIAFIPQPGVVADIVKRDKATAARRRRRHERPQVEHAPRHPRRRHRRRQALRPAGQRQHQELRLVPEEGLGRGGIQGAHDARRAQRADREDQGRQGADAPWCMGIESDAAHRLAGHRLVRGPGHAVRRRRRLQPVGQRTRSSSTPRWCGRPPPSSRRSPSPPGNMLGGRKAIASTNFGTAGNPMFDAQPGCMLYNQGSFITGFFPKDVQATSTRTSACSASRRPGRRREPGPGRRRHGRAAQQQRRRPRGHEAARRQETSARTADGRPASSRPHKDFDVSLYKGEIAQQVAKLFANAGSAT